MANDSMPKFVAEAIGTFILVFVGCSTILSGGARLEIALAFGAALCVVVYAIGKASGAHVNPAVTLAMLATGRIESKTAAGYIFAQLVGATFAAFTLSAVFGNPAAAVNQLGPGISAAEGVIVEAILTFILVFAIFAVVINKNNPEFTGVVLGAVLAGAHLAAIPLTGASLNPARTFGPALVSGAWASHAVYWIGPIAGAVLAALIYQNAFMKKGKRQ